MLASRWTEEDRSRHVPNPVWWSIDRGFRRCERFRNPYYSGCSQHLRATPSGIDRKPIIIHVSVTLFTKRIVGIDSSMIYSSSVRSRFVKILLHKHRDYGLPFNVSSNRFQRQKWQQPRHDVCDVIGSFTESSIKTMHFLAARWQP